MSNALVELGRRLSGMGYHFTTVTPAAQSIVNGRFVGQTARSLRDVFGWSRPFEEGLLPREMMELMRAAEVVERAPNGAWRSTIRFSTLDGVLFAHSAFPTTSEDAVFFGPDSVRFTDAILRAARPARYIVDVGCGTGVGGIMLARRGHRESRVVLADVNPSALRLAQVNAELAGVDAEIVLSDVLKDVKGEVDLVIANPPYLRDDQHRWYRDGQGEYGEGIGARMVREALHRLSANPQGGTLLLYTGAAIIEGNDMFLASVRDALSPEHIRHEYRELDPDVFSEELSKPAYGDVERIAAVFLRAEVGPGGGHGTAQGDAHEP